MTRNRNPIVQLITRSRGSGAWKTLLLVVLVGILTVAHLLGAGQSFPTLVDFFAGAPEQSK